MDKKEDVITALYEIVAEMGLVDTQMEADNKRSYRLNDRGTLVLMALGALDHLDTKKNNEKSN